MTTPADDFAREQINASNSRALGIVCALADYEEEHPKGGLCFRDELDSMQAKASAVFKDPS